VTLAIDVEIVLPASAKAVKTKRVADKAVKQAFQAAEKYLEELKRHSQT
jgi:hypothetical protein